MLPIFRRSFTIAHRGSIAFASFTASKRPVVSPRPEQTGRGRGNFTVRVETGVPHVAGGRNTFSNELEEGEETQPDFQAGNRGAIKILFVSFRDPTLKKHFGRTQKPRS